jgi:hypothetical protein
MIGTKSFLPMAECMRQKKNQKCTKANAESADTLQSLIVLIDVVVMLELVEVYSKHTI